MPATDWDRIQSIFDEALTLAEADRAAFLQRACGLDAELRAEIERLLAHDAAAPADFLAPPTLGCAPGVDDRGAALLGQTIGHFAVQRVLATGGMGTVYEALQDQPHRLVALKIMHHHAASAAALRRFQFEAEVLGRLQHPGIAQVHEAGMHTDTVGLIGPAGGRVPYFAMELVPDARPITVYTKEHELSIRERVELFADVCDAVQHGHQHGVIHRDLKPANILVDTHGRPKVIDFGIARTTDQDLAATTQATVTGALIGTVQYMSPEQCAGDRARIDTRSDVYALGVVLYELLTGALPYVATGVGLLEAARAIREAVPPRPSTVDRRVRGDLETVVLKALEKDPARRYGTAAELAADLRRYVRGEPVAARPPSAWTHAVRWTLRHPVLATAAACLVVAVLMIGSAWGAVSWIQNRPFDVRISANGRTAWLVPAVGDPLHEWDSGDEWGVKRVGFVRQPQEFGGRTLALLLFCGNARQPHRGAVCAFDLAGDLERPLWEARLRSDDIQGEMLGRDLQPGSFYAASCLMADFFPELPGDEVAVEFSETDFSRAIQIYNLQGDVLYRFWHRGGAAVQYWMDEPGLLICAGTNADATWPERGCATCAAPNLHPFVVFAVRPTPHRLADRLIATAPGDPLDDVVWYKCVLPAELSAALSGVTAVRPPDSQYPRGRNCQVSFGFRLAPMADFHVVVNEHGQVVPGTLRRGGDWTTPEPALPDLSSFDLGDLPPVLHQQPPVDAAP